MAVTQNTYTGDGATVLFSFTFPYLENTDIKVSLNGVDTTAYTLANATTIEFDNAPTNGAAIRIFRVTDDSDLAATFYPGSAIRSQDLNENFTQNLYVTQESNRDATTAISTAEGAVTTANAATSTANTALSTANSAVSTANAATSTAAGAASTASSALSTANAATAAAAGAVSTANTANSTASAALSAVSEALQYTTVANVAAIPAAPSNGDAVRVLNSTGIQAFTPLTGVPGGYVGDAGLTVEIYYDGPTSTWIWSRYFPTDPEARYVATADIGVSVQAYDATLLNSADIGVTVQGYDATTLKSADIGVTVQGYDATTLKSADIGSTVQAYDADTAKTDVVQSFTKAQRGSVVTLTPGATVTPDFSAGNNFSLALNANTTLANPTNVAAGQSGAITITQDSTARTLAYGNQWHFEGGIPTLGTTTGAVSTLVYYADTTTRITAVLLNEPANS